MQGVLIIVIKREFVINTVSVNVSMDTKAVIAGMFYFHLLVQLLINTFYSINSKRSCPRGRKLVSIANDTDSAHNIAECSGNGLCDYKTGECSCATPFTGNDCSRFKWYLLNLSLTILRCLLLF